METKQKTETREITLRVEGIKETFKGFRIIVGKQKGSGMFEYFRGTKKQALKRAEQMKECR